MGKALAHAEKKYQGAFQNLETQLTTEDPNQLTNFRRMDNVAYSELLQKITPFISMKDTVMRQAIEPGERLLITLRCLATTENLPTGDQILGGVTPPHPPLATALTHMYALEAVRN
ncbi:hypothetical protein HOLleu_05389 [Holothuria leucospilota]|uniref:BAR domain-containing protein n=1 Tax=Holothuria leucospilota TaxID=206669 RepID=A0A9Q1CL12_HOLLE|nr:hypothetical protein HOLleu_05389 [Holothuria leucospilota]